MDFDNFKGKQVVIPPIEDKCHGDRTHTRDPKVWKGKNGGKGEASVLSEP